MWLPFTCGDAAVSGRLDLVMVLKRRSRVRSNMTEIPWRRIWGTTRRRFLESNNGDFGQRGGRGVLPGVTGSGVVLGASGSEMTFFDVSRINGPGISSARAVST